VDICDATREWAFAPMSRDASVTQRGGQGVGNCQTTLFGKNDPIGIGRSAWLRLAEEASVLDQA